MIIVFNFIYRSLLVILLITSCSGGSSSTSSYIEPIIPDPVTPEFVECDNYQGETENLIWIEDFNNDLNLLDDTTWTSIEGNGQEYGIPGWGNNELQYYTDSTLNASLNNGCLKITPLNQSSNGYNYTSAKIETKNKVDFSNSGKITVRFRSPSGVGMWPAIWMMPRDSIYGGWPASGEIDLVEIRGNNMQEILSTIHFGSDWANHQYLGGSFYLPQDNNLNDYFHELSFVWEEDKMSFILDNEHTVFEVLKSQIGFDENYPFNEIFYLIINVAVGGNFVGNYVDNNDLCSIDDYGSCPDSKRFIIDWIVYENL